MKKEFIKKLYDEKAKNDSNSEDLANTLNILSKTVFGDINRFVFELLQNADDSPNPDSQAELNVTFHLFDNYLLFSHNGKHFDSSDAKGISRVGSRDSGKDKKMEKTGYKGIGFKSIFGTSNCVQIISNGYKFKFDKHHSLWNNDKSYPWQVIPIWSEEIPEELAPFIDFKNVNTIIKVTNKEILYSEILDVFEDCQIILFLRNINTIQFKQGNSTEFEILKKITGANTCKLYYNDNLRSSWYISDFSEEITDSLREKLSKLSDEECPRKLKEAKRTKLTFAALIEKDKLKSLSNAIVYNYLPTKVNYGFPYIINGDFITNAERTQLLKNDWNKFLLHTIATAQINLLVELNATEFKKDVLHLLKGEFSHTSDNLKIAFNNGLSEAINDVAFVPDILGTKLLKPQECLIDSLEYSKYFHKEHIIELYPNKPSLVNQGLTVPEKLITFGASQFDEENIESLFKSHTFISAATSNKIFNFRLINFLFKNNLSTEILKKLKFILDNTGQLQTPENLYFPSKSFTKAISFTELTFVDINIFTKINKYEDLKKWLTDLGVRSPKNIEILRKSIFPMINKDHIALDNALEVTHFSFNLFANGELTDNDYTTLRKIKLLTNNGLIVASDSYLSDIYNPILRLESLVPEKNYVSNQYISNNSNSDTWKNFFLKLFVKEKITVVKYNQIERGKLISTVPDASGYLTWIDNNEHYALIYRPYRNSGQHSVSNFKYFYFLSHLSNFLFAKQFWDILLNDWNGYSLDNPKTKYNYLGGGVEIPDYLSYYLRNFPSIPATDKKCYKSDEVFVPRFKNIVQDKYPVADFKSTLLSKEQINYLGLKQFIDIDNCILMLENLTQEDITNEIKKQIFALYDEIIKSDKEGNKITTDISTIMLLSLNNSYQSVDSLYHFNISSLSPSVSSNRFIQFPDSFSDEDKALFCKMFDILEVTYSDLDFNYENRENDETLKAKIGEILPFLSTIIAHKDSLEFNKIFDRLNAIIDSTTVYKAETLTLLYRDREEEIIFNSSITTWPDGNSFYFSGDWTNPLTLYSLCSLLGDYLKIENIDRELSLFLQINKTEIKDWLTEKGYEIPELTNLPEAYLEMEDDQTSMVADETDPTMDYPEFLTIEEFEPEVEANLADTANVKINNISHESVNYPNVSKDHTKSKNDEIKIDIGRWSEEYVYSYLKSQNKYESINWLNKDEEAYLPYDFVVVENQKEKYIEVKGTSSKDKSEFYMSKNEWNLMFEKKADYSIYRLFNAGKKEGLEIKIIEKPYLLIQNGNMLSYPISVYI